jgi:hypothetical protein
MAFKFNTDFINLGPLTSTNFGIEPLIDVKCQVRLHLCRTQIY